MGNVPELPGDLDCIFGLVGAKKVDGMVDAGGSELGLTPPRTSCGLWTVLRPDPDEGRDAAVRLWCNWHDRMASSEEGGGLGIGCREEVFMVGGSWFERGVRSCLHHVEPFNMSHDLSRSLECKSWDNAGQDDGHITLRCVGNKTVSMLSPQCGEHISANTDRDYVTCMSTER